MPVGRCQKMDDLDSEIFTAHCFGVNLIYIIQRRIAEKGEKSCQISLNTEKKTGVLVRGFRYNDVEQRCQSAVEEFTLVEPGDDAVTMNWDGEETETGVFNDILMTAGKDACRGPGPRFPSPTLSKCRRSVRSRSAEKMTESIFLFSTFQGRRRRSPLRRPRQIWTAVRRRKAKSHSRHTGQKCISSEPGPAFTYDQERSSRRSSA